MTPPSTRAYIVKVQASHRLCKCTHKRQLHEHQELCNLLQTSSGSSSIPRQANQYPSVVAQEGKSSTDNQDQRSKVRQLTDPRQARPNRDAEKRLLDRDETQRLPRTRGARYSCGKERGERGGLRARPAACPKSTIAQVGRVEALAPLDLRGLALLSDIR